MSSCQSQGLGRESSCIFISSLKQGWEYVRLRYATVVNPDLLLLGDRKQIFNHDVWFRWIMSYRALIVNQHFNGSYTPFGYLPILLRLNTRPVEKDRYIDLHYPRPQQTTWFSSTMAWEGQKSFISGKKKNSQGVKMETLVKKMSTVSIKTNQEHHNYQTECFC